MTLTRQQREILIQKVKELPPDASRSIMTIILNNNPTQKYSKNISRLLIKIDTLDESVLSQISNFVQNYKEVETDTRKEDLENYEMKLNASKPTPQSKFDKENVKALMNAVVKLQFSEKELPNDITPRDPVYSAQQKRILRKLRPPKNVKFGEISKYFVDGIAEEFVECVSVLESDTIRLDKTKNVKPGKKTKTNTLNKKVILKYDSGDESNADPDSDSDSDSKSVNESDPDESFDSENEDTEDAEDAEDEDNPKESDGDAESDTDT
jgi:hypothetical protein